MPGVTSTSSLGLVVHADTHREHMKELLRGIKVTSGTGSTVTAQTAGSRMNKTAKLQPSGQ